MVGRRVCATVVALVLAAVAGCGSGSGAAPTIESLSPSPSGSEAARPSPSSSSSPDSPAPAATSSDARRPTGAPVTIALGGDVHFERMIASRLARDPATTFGPVADVLRRADLAMVNLETAVTTGGTPVPKSFTFRAPPSAFTALHSAGVDVATEANNHGEDYGVAGLRDSIEAARAADFPLVGVGLDEDDAFAPYLATVHGQRLAVIGATQVLDATLADAWTAGRGKPGLASAKDVPRLLAAVRAVRSRADTVLVYLHWGEELNACPLDRQRVLARQLVDAGADVVVGSHAHVLLGAGYLDGAYVDYGLGNFLFYARGSGLTVQSGVLTLTVRGRAVTDANWTPARISDGQPQPLPGAAARAALASWQALRGCTGLAPSARPPE